MNQPTINKRTDPETGDKVFTLRLPFAWLVSEPDPERVLREWLIRISTDAGYAAQCARQSMRYGTIDIQDAVVIEETRELPGRPRELTA